MIWKLLRKHVSVTQLAGFALANIVGLTIVMLAVQMATDIRPVIEDEDSFLRRDYIVITRSVTTTGALMGSPTDFSAADVADIEAQPWCGRVGQFSASEFGVEATVGLGGSGHAMRTQFFFEAIPTDFIDVNSADWTFNPNRPEVPVIISRDYLSLYNFGFATTQGLPRISEGQMEMIPLQFTLSGNGLRETLNGRIVGFSTRLNTVIVPQDFMTWANNRYGDGNTQRPQRLIIESTSPGDVAIDQYMESHNYDVAGDKTNSSRAGHLLTVATGVVVAVGAVISLLAFFVLMLSIYLLLQKNVRKLQTLLLLGYSPAEVSAPYVKIVAGVNLAALVIAFAAVIAIRAWYMPTLRALGVDGGTITTALLCGIVIMTAISAGNIFAIRRRVAALWHG